MTDTAGMSGQAGADSTGTTAIAPGSDLSGSVGQASTTGNGSSPAEESFFDPTSIAGKPELETAYKQMQREFTKRLQGISQSQTQIDAYKQFEQDPMGTLKRVAAQYGVSIVPQDQNQAKDFNPQSWEDVLTRARDEVRKEFEPLIGEVKNLKKQNIESFLDTNHPDWRTYEDKMMATLKAHPSLVQDPSSLYRLAVPPEVLEQRAAKTALQKLKATSDTTQVSGSTNVKQTTHEPITPGPNAFAQAIQAAHKKLSASGFKRPSH